MKEALKNPNLYYIAVPVVAAVFALMAAFIFYPASVKSWQDNQSEYTSSQEWIEKILTLEPERLAFKVDSKGNAEQFDFSVVVDEFAKAFSISPSNYSTSVKGEIKKQGKLARTATLSIKSIDIENLCKFLSTMLARWPDLECDILSLDKIKTGKDLWKADLTLTYYF